MNTGCICVYVQVTWAVVAAAAAAAAPAAVHILLHTETQLTYYLHK